MGWTHAARAGSLHHAALVVQHSSGRVLSRCVAFLDDQITGFQLVQRSGIEYQAQAFGSMGNAVCQLDYEPQGVPASCFGSGAYWQYFHRTPSGWAQSSAGASSWALHDGEMDGWHYASGTGQPPANVTFSSVCAPAPPPAASATNPTRHASPQPLGAGQPGHAATPAGATASAAATAVVTPSLEALAPSSSTKVALADTGRHPALPQRGRVAVVWWLLAGGTALLLAVGALNLRRRGP